MKRALLLTICLVFAAGLAYAADPQGQIGVFADRNGTNCNIELTGDFRMYVVHINTLGTTACQFGIETDPDISANFDFWQAGSGFSVIETPAGSYQSVGIAYGSCMTGTFWIAAMWWYGLYPDPCSRISVVADPFAQVPGIYEADCTTPNPVDYEIENGGTAYFNNTGNCDCNVPAEDTSWGQIKAMYQ